MQLKLIQKNNETILPITFYGKNRNEEVLNYHKKVMDFWRIPINYIEMDFSRCGHGDAIQFLVNSTLSSNCPDYYWFLDMDCIPLRQDFVDILYSKICDKNSIFGPALATNHRKFADHIYAAAFCLSFSKWLYLDLGRPLMTDTIERSDNSQELTWKCQEKGKVVSFIYPSRFVELSDNETQETGNPKYFNLGKYHKYGMATQYGDLLFHGFVQNIPRSNKLFIEKCQQILGEDNRENSDKKVECIIVCKDYGDYLELTLPENIKYFDNIIVVTSPEDTITQEVCRENRVKCLIYNDFNKNGAVFNKGGALQFGLNHIDYFDYVCFLDSDIIIKQEFKNKLYSFNKFYGSYRRFIPNLSSYLDLLDNKKSNDDFHDVREGSGNGFFQIFNCQNTTVSRYGLNNIYEDSFSATEVDINMLRKFCPLIENDGNLERTGIELWHLGVADAQNNMGRSDKDTFFVN